MDYLILKLSPAPLLFQKPLNPLCDSRRAMQPLKLSASGKATLRRAVGKPLAADERCYANAVSEAKHFDNLSVSPINSLTFQQAQSLAHKRINA